MSDAPGALRFADLLRSFRRSAGLSQAALAQRAELNPRSIKYLESGTRQPYPDTIRRLAVALALPEAARRQLVAAAEPVGASRRMPPAPTVPEPTMPPVSAPTVSTPGAPAGPRHNVPAALTSFIGRSQELAELQSLLGEARLVTLIGPGGIGKTRLALEAVAERLEAYPEGVWLVDLAGLADATQVPTALAGALDRRQPGERSAPAPTASPGGSERRQPGERPAGDWLADALRHRHLLLVLDNCEHVIAACAELADSLLRACSRIEILATSREALGAPGEHVLRVPPLHVPTGEQSLAALRHEPAVELFAERARAAAGFVLTAQNVGAVVEICRRLDGIPLAIELAAGRTSLLTAQEIASRLDDRFRLLAAGVRTGPARHQTLGSVVAWSYDLASEPQQRLFERLAVFAGGWTLEAAEAVCGGVASGTDDDSLLSTHSSLLNTLGQLVAQSMVTTEQEGNETRFRLLETLREYAAERLAERGEDAMMRRRHASYYAELAEASEWGVHGPDQARWVDRLEREHDNLEAALRWSARQREAVLGYRLVGALCRYWHTRPRGFDDSRWLAQVLALDATDVPPAIVAKVLIGATARALLGQDLDDARRYCRAGLDLYAPLGDSFDHARAVIFGGFVASADGDPARASELMHQSLAMFRRLGDRWGEGLAFGNLGVLATDQGDLERAVQFLVSSTEAFRDAGDAFELAVGLAKLGDIALRQGDLERARRYYEESLDQYHAAGTAHGDPLLLYNRACVLRQQGKIGAAAQLYHETLGLHRERDEPAGISTCLLGLAELALAARQTTLAARLLGAVDRLPRRILRGWIWPDERGPYEYVQTTARATLGDLAFDLAFAEGQALTPEQALAETSILTEGEGAPTRLRPRRQMA